MGLIEVLPEEPVAIDTAVVIYLVVRHERYLPGVRPLFEAADAGDRELVTSAVTLLEVLVVHDMVPFLESLFERESARLASLREEIEAALASAGLTDTVASVALFGSAARGEARPDSDLDLLVLVRDRSRTEAAGALLGAVSDRLRER